MTNTCDWSCSPPCAQCSQEFEEFQLDLALVREELRFKLDSLWVLAEARDAIGGQS